MEVVTFFKGLLPSPPLSFHVQFFCRRLLLLLFFLCLCMTPVFLHNAVYYRFSKGKRGKGRRTKKIGFLEFLRFVIVIGFFELQKFFMCSIRRVSELLMKADDEEKTINSSFVFSSSFPSSPPSALGSAYRTSLPITFFFLLPMNRDGQLLNPRFDVGPASLPPS